MRVASMGLVRLLLGMSVSIPNMHGNGGFNIIQSLLLFEHGGLTKTGHWKRER